MFFIVVVVHSFRRYLLEYFSLCIYSLYSVRIVRVICAVHEDVDVLLL
jgi:hypothetical protein